MLIVKWLISHFLSWEDYVRMKCSNFLRKQFYLFYHSLFSFLISSKVASVLIIILVREMTAIFSIREKKKKSGFLIEARYLLAWNFLVWLNFYSALQVFCGCFFIHADHSQPEFSLYSPAEQYTCDRSTLSVQCQQNRKLLRVFCMPFLPLIFQ